jgi:hypothetical protein
LRSMISEPLAIPATERARRTAAMRGTAAFILSQRTREAGRHAPSNE